jgi:hypothetical protein
MLVNTIRNIKLLMLLSIFSNGILAVITHTKAITKKDANKIIFCKFIEIGIKKTEIIIKIIKIILILGSTLCNHEFVLIY